MKIIKSSAILLMLFIGFNMKADVVTLPSDICAVSYWDNLGVSNLGGLIKGNWVVWSGDDENDDVKQYICSDDQEPGNCPKWSFCQGTEPVPGAQNPSQPTYSEFFTWMQNNHPEMLTLSHGYNCAKDEYSELTISDSASLQHIIIY